MPRPVRYKVVETTSVTDESLEAIVNDLVARVTKQPESAFADWVFTGEDYYHDPDARPNLTALQANLVVQKELGFLKADIDATHYADLSLVDDAAKRPRT